VSACKSTSAPSLRVIQDLPDYVFAETARGVVMRKD
jgi:hypothetical protein